MGFINKTLKRTRTGEIRLEEDRKGIIGDFFSNQDDAKSHQIVDEENWTVDIDGDIHIYKEDLVDGVLPFNIGKLTGNLYAHVRNFKPGVIPLDMDGEIIFVPDEGTMGSQGNDSDGDDKDSNQQMELIRTKKPTTSDVRTKLRAAIADAIAYGEGIDIETLLGEVKDEMENREQFQLRIEFPDTGSNFIHCNIFVRESDKEDDGALKFNAIQKAFYLLFILLKDGFVVDDLETSHWKMLKKIYSQLAGRVEKTYITNKKTNEEVEYTNGVLQKAFIPTTVRGYLTEIRAVIQEKISFKDIVDEFAIEGSKGKEFKIQRATDEMRELIREKFGLD